MGSGGAESHSGGAESHSGGAVSHSGGAVTRCLFPLPPNWSFYSLTKLSISVFHIIFILPAFAVPTKENMSEGFTSRITECGAEKVL